jgi:dephospho-CoA kinase
MLKIGLTGGIGSGKTTVAGIFEVLEIPVYYADQAARQLMNNDPVIKMNIIRDFGEESYLEEGLNRPFLSREVFGNPEKLARLNAIVHPVTIEDANRWMRDQTSPYAIKEAALIFETSAKQWLDHVIGVFAPQTLRIERTMNRDQISREEVLKRMKNQLPEEKKMSLCDFVIHNDDLQPVLLQVLALHEKLLLLAKK